MYLWAEQTQTARQLVTEILITQLVDSSNWLQATDLTRSLQDGTINKILKRKRKLQRKYEY